MDGYKIENRRHQEIILFCVSLAVFISAIDASIINIVLPTLARTFKVDTGQVLWVTILYLIIVTVFMVSFGKLGDRKGYRKIFLPGLLLFTLGSFLCGTSQVFREILFYRGIQAFGGAMIKATGIAIITTFLPSEKQGEYLGIYAVAAAVGYVTGPAAGGFLTHYFGWQWIFFVNVPFGITGFILSYLFIPKKQPPPTEKRIDAAGSILFILMISVSLLTINMGREFGWNSLIIRSGFVMSILIAAGFYYFEKRVKEPFIDFSLFRNREFILNNITSFSIYLVFAGALILFPFYFELIKGFDVKTSGIYLAVYSLVNLVLSKISGKLSDRIGSKMLCISGILLGGAAFFIGSRTGSSTEDNILFAVMALFGASLALFLPPNSSLIMKHTPDNKKGLGSSLMLTLRTLAIIYGICLFETIFSETLPKGMTPSISAIHKSGVSISMITEGFSRAFTAGLIICIMSLLICLFIKDTPPAEEESSKTTTDL